jgi:uncharacterized UBP type Zn finger protein
MPLKTQCAKRRCQGRVANKNLFLNTPAARPKHSKEEHFVHRIRVIPNTHTHLNTPDASLRRLAQPLPAPIFCHASSQVGIPNYGNTCFFSTVYQMMCVLWPVVQCNDELRTGHESSCGCINCAFHATVTELLMRRRLPVPSQPRPPISAIALLKILREITKKFAENLQHDSFELYDSLLEHIGLGQQSALHFRRKGTCAACTYKFDDNCTR